MKIDQHPLLIVNIPLLHHSTTPSLHGFSDGQGHPSLRAVGSPSRKLRCSQSLILWARILYWQDLSRNRENGWSLFGLLQSLRAQEKTEQAAVIEDRFRKAWNRADVTLTASRYMGDYKTRLAARSDN